MDFVFATSVFVPVIDGAMARVFFILRNVSYRIILRMDYLVK